MAGFLFFYVTNPLRRTEPTKESDLCTKENSSARLSCSRADNMSTGLDRIREEF